MERCNKCSVELVEGGNWHRRPVRGRTCDTCWTARNRRYWNRDDWNAYQRDHQRHAYQEGPASNYACVDCGAQAEQWSTQHGEEVFMPRCKTCHQVYDRR